MFDEALRIRRQAHGDHHPAVAAALNNRATLAFFLGDEARAERLHREALAIREAVLGPFHPEVAASLINLATVLAISNQWPEAADDLDRARRIALRHAATVLPVLTERAQRSFLEWTDQNHLFASLSLALAHADEAATVRRSAAWVLNGKALVRQTLAEQARLARAARDRDPKTAEIAQDLQAKRAERAHLVLELSRHPPGPESNVWAKIEDLNRQELALAWKLAQNLGRSQRAAAWIELDEVRRAVPADGVLVEMARFNLFRPSRRADLWRPAHYAAWIIPPAGKGEVRLIDLGPAAEIDEAVQAVRAALHDAPGILSEQTEERAEARLQPALKALAQRILEPLLPQIGPAERWLAQPRWRALAGPLGRAAARRRPPCGRAAHDQLPGQRPGSRRAATRTARPARPQPDPGGA